MGHLYLELAYLDLVSPREDLLGPRVVLSNRMGPPHPSDHGFSARKRLAGWCLVTPGLWVAPVWGWLAQATDWLGSVTPGLWVAPV